MLKQLKSSNKYRYVWVTSRTPCYYQPMTCVQPLLILCSYQLIRWSVSVYDIAPVNGRWQHESISVALRRCCFSCLCFVSTWQLLWFCAVCNTGGSEWWARAPKGRERSTMGTRRLESSTTPGKRFFTWGKSNALSKILYFGFQKLAKCI